MKSRTLCLVLIALVGVYSSPLVLAQTEDTTSAWRYYPLQIGNVWEYRGSYFAPGDSRTEIVGDTIIADVHYFLEATAAYFDGEFGPYTQRPVRFDTTTSNVFVRWEDGTESLWQISRSCPLDTPFGTVECLAETVEVEGGYDEEFELHFGYPLTGVTIKSFHATTRSYFIADIGWGGYDLVVEPGGTRLSYARIDAIEYGEPFPVAAEAVAPEESAVALAAFPNPSRGATTIRCSLDRPQQVRLTVYDVLGRRVLSEDLGAQPAGETTHPLGVAGLPMGLFTSSGSRATREQLPRRGSCGSKKGSDRAGRSL